MTLKTFSVFSMQLSLRQTLNRNRRLPTTIFKTTTLKSGPVARYQNTLQMISKTVLQRILNRCTLVFAGTSEIFFEVIVFMFLKVAMSWLLTFSINSYKTKSIGKKKFLEASSNKNKSLSSIQCCLRCCNWSSRPKVFYSSCYQQW